MRYIVGFLGLVAASVLFAVSAAMNWRFGYYLGKTELDSHILGAASAASDGLKAVLPFFIYAAWRHRHYLRSAAGAMIWVVCLGYSLASALGFSALNRADVAGQRQIEASSYQDMRAELDRARERLAFLPKTRSVGELEFALQAELAKSVKASGRTRTVGELVGDCQGSSYWQRLHCGDILTLKSDLAAAKEAEALEARTQALHAQLAALSGTTRVLSDDPQAQFLSGLTGLDRSQVELVLVVLVAALVELGSGLGFFVVLGPWRHGGGAQGAQAREEVVADGPSRAVVTLAPAVANEPTPALIGPTAATAPSDAVAAPALVAEERETAQDTRPVPTERVEPAVAEGLREDNPVRAITLSLPTPANDWVPEARAPIAKPESAELRSTSVLAGHAGDVATYFRAEIEAADGAAMAAKTVYDDYCAWCEDQDIEPLALPTFARELNALGIQRAKIAGRIRYVGIRKRMAGGEISGNGRSVARITA